MVGRFLASPRAAEIAAAEKVYRELEFLLAWPPDGDQAATGAGGPQPRDVICKGSSTVSTATPPGNGGWSTIRRIA